MSKTKPDKKDVLRQLGRLAFGSANDCVALALQGETAKLGQLDLSLLAGIKRGKDGSVEVKLVDRLQALRDLAVLVDGDGSPESLLQALCREDDEA